MSKTLGHLKTPFENPEDREPSFLRTLVDEMISAGLDPHMAQQGLSKEEPGVWVIAGKEMPKELDTWVTSYWEGVSTELVDRGRVVGDRHFKPWHGNFLHEQAHWPAIATRVKLVRHWMGSSVQDFYGRIGMAHEGELYMEQDQWRLSPAASHLLSKLAAAHGIAFEWLVWGTAAELTKEDILVWLYSGDREVSAAKVLSVVDMLEGEIERPRSAYSGS